MSTILQSFNFDQRRLHDELEVSRRFSSGSLHDQAPFDVEYSGSSPPKKDDEGLEVWQGLTFVVCGLLVAFTVPAVAYGLYKKSIIEVLNLTAAEGEDIVSFGLIGGYCFGFIPGLVYDRFGYSATLVCGGTMASSGALWCYWLLKDAELVAPVYDVDAVLGAPSWLSLALALMLMFHGCRYLYITAVCAVLCAFPTRLVGTMSGGLAICVSGGYILTSVLWQKVFLPPLDDADAYNLKTGNLTNLRPVANFFASFAVVYVFATLGGLSIARWLPRGQASAGGAGQASRFRKLRDPDAIALILCVIVSLTYLSLFISSGVAEAGHRAGAGSQETASVVVFMHAFGMVGRFLHGCCADLLCTRTPALSAGRDLMFVFAAATSAGALGMMLLDKSSWKIGCCMIGFSFGGFTALLPAAVRMTFGAASVGFWMGMLFVSMGVMNFFYGRVGAALEWSDDMFFFGTCGGIFTTCMFLVVAWMHWGKSSI